MNDIIKAIENEQLKSDITDFNVGDTVKAVSYTHLIRKKMIVFGIGPAGTGKTCLLYTSRCV